MATGASPKRWQDQLVLILGIWIIISPFVFSYPYGSGGAINAYCSGALMVILAAVSMAGTFPWAVGLNVLLSIWVIVCPWVVNDIPDTSFDANEISAGIVSIILLVWELQANPELSKFVTRTRIS